MCSNGYRGYYDRKGDIKKTVFNNKDIFCEITYIYEFADKDLFDVYQEYKGKPILTLSFTDKTKDKTMRLNDLLFEVIIGDNVVQATKMIVGIDSMDYVTFHKNDEVINYYNNSSTPHDKENEFLFVFSDFNNEIITLHYKIEFSSNEKIYSSEEEIGLRRGD